MARYITADDADAAEAMDEAAVDESSEEPTAEGPEGDESEDTPEGDEVGDEPDEQDGQEAEDESEDEEPGDDPSYTVRVDGIDTEVPVSELIKGYMRTADYTRKTQLLGAQRRQLADAEALLNALENNPAATIQVLARHYNVESEYGEDDPGPSAEQRRIMELEQWQQAELARQREAAVDMELARLHREYGDFDEEALFTFAVDRRVADLETALKAMVYGRQAAARQTNKRKAAAVAGGQGRNGAAHPKQPPAQITTFRDAYEAAKRELELGSTA